MSESPDVCWVLHDGAAGNRRQALALAAALTLPTREWSLRLDLPYRWVSPQVWPGSAGGFDAGFAAALRTGPMPTLAIGCGRLAALATRLLRARGVRVVQILNPRIDPAHWDVVVAPEHDRLAGANVLTLTGSLSPVDEPWLAQARRDFPALGALPGPRTAVLLGGPTPAVAFGRSAFEVLASKLEYTLARDGGSVIVCGSRRTPPELHALVHARYGETPGLVWMEPRDGGNPYAGALAWADRLIVSPDSVNMISEACATDKPVYVAEPGRASGRIRDFLRSLETRGRLRAQERVLEPFAVTPLRETPRVAAQLREYLSLD